MVAILYNVIERSAAYGFVLAESVNCKTLVMCFLYLIPFPPPCC